MIASPGPPGINSATSGAKEEPMSDRTPAPQVNDPDRDPDDDSTWSTIDNTADIDELVNEEDLENFLVEPIPDPFADPLDRSNS
jgi:hypothetical protein